jgi:hypothetical protein
MADSESPETRAKQEQEQWYERTRYQILLYVGGIIFIVLALWLVLDSYIDPRTSTEKKDLVQALGLILVGVAAAIGIFFTWRGQRITRIGQDMTQQSTQEQLQLTRDSLESTQKDTEQQLRLTQQVQLTERFTRAIDQLGAAGEDGAKSLEIRLGGIYALEQLARDSRSYHWPIMEVLTAYVREHASPSQLQDRVSREVDRLLYEYGESGEISRQRREEVKEEVDSNAFSPELDIQAILTVVGRRTRHSGYIEPAQLDLRHVAIPNVGLYRAKLREAILYGANLARATLAYAYLPEANLRGASLRDANLSRAELSGAELSYANLIRTNLRGANLRGVKGLTQEQLEQANGDSSTRLPDYLSHPSSWT